MNPADLQVSTLGPCQYPSPLRTTATSLDPHARFRADDAKVLYEIELGGSNELDSLAFELAGPREQIFFRPQNTQAAVVTCGGLCPGLNNVVRTLFFELSVNYGLADVWGIRFGYEGLNPEVGRPPVRLSGSFVEEIHHLGGTVLGTSRGPQSPRVIVDYLQQLDIQILFCVGGDGTQRGAHKIAAEAKQRNLPIAVVGIPKTIDNDIKHCYRTFGFLSAVSEAEKVIDRAHVEAKSVRNGIGLVKLMGREAGFIAAAATVASGQVNFTLIPEQPFELEGPQGLLGKLERRLAAREHAVIVVAEGAGQNLLAESGQGVDASGNRKLGDVGAMLSRTIKDHFQQRDIPVSVKYFDPSYHIRSVPANTADSLLCEQLARSAAHAAMAGKTDLLIGLWHNRFVHVPLPMTTGVTKCLSLESDLWKSVLAMTQQEKW